ncbi:DUF86 domain-containing protein [Rhodoferax sp.]|uniref:HepT-like ribonuclease domain-containing protein n=1 Tax=Rhodoferax sp. TaxID=50421 RepID=UPI001ECE63BF|nr:DUF86 domain-containing protein [Rhodoferax sp.]MBT9506217.1 DUF86 domain-containing protein [Rhodoferax sp.]
MSASNRIPDYLDHMLEAAKQACDYVEGLTKEDFLGDKKTQQAVVLNLILIGEEAAKLLKEYETFANEHPRLPLRNMKGMRNRIAHGYFEINLDTVWETVKTALPQLIQQLPDIRNSLR